MNRRNPFLRRRLERLPPSLLEAWCRAGARGRDSGIALMVVFVVFTILIVVVYQLQYSTKLEEAGREAGHAASDDEDVGEAMGDPADTIGLEARPQ